MSDASKRVTTSAIPGFTVSETRKCLLEIKQRWKTANPQQVLYFSEPLDAAPPQFRPLSMEGFAFRFILGQATKRDTKTMKYAYE